MNKGATDPEKYECAACNQEFEALITDKEAQAEFDKQFGKHFSIEDASVICDDCYNKIMKGVPSLH